MKKKVSKDLVIFIILIPLFLWGSFYISNAFGGNLPSYSIESKAKMGYSVFFQVLKNLDYPVYRGTTAVNEEKVDSLQIVVSGKNFDVNSKEVEEWVKKGGILVYLVPGNISFIDYGKVSEQKDNIKIIKHSKGKIITTDAGYITNKAMAKNSDNAYKLLKTIDEEIYESIYFNEKYMMGLEQQTNLWDYMTIEYKFIFYQALIVCIGYLYFKGKRFGKPIILYEEEERSGNEYLYSASALYRHAKCWDLIVENYYRSFLKQINRGNEDWLEFWQEQELPSFAKAKRLHDFMHKTQRKVKVKVKEYVQIVAIIEHLKSNWSKRRDLHWKTLKRTT